MQLENQKKLKYIKKYNKTQNKINRQVRKNEVRGFITFRISLRVWKFVNVFNNAKTIHYTLSNDISYHCDGDID